MTDPAWRPHTTVASICELDGRYLLVRERVDGRVVYNQPAGHLEPGESLLDAVIRETLEETRYRFEPLALQGVYRYRPSAASELTYLRFGFRGKVGTRLDGSLDQGIIAAEWLTYEELLDCRAQHRSPMVLQCVDDYRAGRGYPLDIFSPEFS